jgi:hypothetical protein
MVRLLLVPLSGEHSLFPENSSWEEPRPTSSDLTVFLPVGLGTLQER